MLHGGLDLINYIKGGTVILYNPIYSFLESGTPVILWSSSLIECTHQDTHPLPADFELDDNLHDDGDCEKDIVKYNSMFLFCLFFSTKK